MADEISVSQQILDKEIDDLLADLENTEESHLEDEETHNRAHIRLNKATAINLRMNRASARGVDFLVANQKLRRKPVSMKNVGLVTGGTVTASGVIYAITLAVLKFLQGGV